MKKVLIVEDEPHLRLLYEMELDHAGYGTMTAANANECLEYIETMPIDLVILDLRMPGMDGIEVLQNIIARRRSLPVIIHTAYNCYRDNYLTWGAAAYLAKSSNLGELIATVDGLLKPENLKPSRRDFPPSQTMHTTERTDHVEQTL